MPQIDLRNTTLELRDGFSLAAKVNQPASPGPIPADGDTTLTIDGLAVAIPNGIEMRLDGVDAVYHVVSSTGGATPTAVTFTPALSTAAGLPVDDGNITFGPHVVEIKVGEGTLTYNERQEMEYVRNKRRIAFVRYGDEQPMDVTFNIVWEFIRSDTGETPTVEEVLKKEGNASTYVTSGTDICEPYAVDIRILYTPPCSGVKAEETILKEFRREGLNHNVKDGTIEASGKCKIGNAIHNRIVA